MGYKLVSLSHLSFHNYARGIAELGNLLKYGYDGCFVRYSNRFLVLVLTDTRNAKLFSLDYLKYGFSSGYHSSTPDEYLQDSDLDELEYIEVDLSAEGIADTLYDAGKMHSMGGQLSSVNISMYTRQLGLVKDDIEVTYLPMYLVNCLDVGMFFNRQKLSYGYLQTS